jgi:hypothetical protein
MKFKARILVLIAGISGTSALGLSKTTEYKRLQELRDVSTRLEGALDSSRQSILDRDYVDVRVTQCLITVTDLPAYLNPSLFLYVEQALSLTLSAPYRQRVIKLSPNRSEPSGVVSSIFELNLPQMEILHLCSKKPHERIVSWTDLNDVSCSVYMRKNQDLWVGETQSTKCPNSYGSAKFVSSKVILSRSGMYSWDQGWDENGNQVWGAVKGGYNFEKIDPATTDVELNAVASRYVGKLNTFKQAAKLPDVFQPIKYNNCLIETPTLSQKSGKTLLIDQSADTPNLKFSRTKFLRLERNAQKELTATYLSLRDSAKYQGMCDKPYSMRTAKAEDVLAPECQIIFKRDGTDFVGSTPEEGCPSTYRGAVKLTVSARLTRGSIQVLERWYDKEGRQVAGSTQGPYFYELED